MSNSCERMHELAFDVALGRACNEDRVAYEQHVASCEACQRTAQLAPAVVGRVQDMPRDLSPSRREHIFAALLPEIERATGRRWWHVSAWRRALLLVPVGAAVALAVVLFVPRVDRRAPGEPELSAQILHRSGTFEIAAAQGRAQPRVDALAIESGSTLATGAGGEVALAVVSDRFLLGQASRVHLARLRHSAVELGLEQGNLIVEADPQARHRSFVVRAPFGTVTVVGTRFRVRTDDGGEVATMRGRVRVEADGQIYHVGAGQVLHVAQKRIETMDDTVREALMSGLDFEHRAPAQTEPAVEAPRSSQSRKTVVRSVVSTPLGKQLVGLIQAGDCAAAETMARGRRGLSPAEAAEALALAAQCYQAARDDHRALGLYRGIQRQYAATPTAENAWFEVGRILERSGEAKEARRTFARFAQRYPKSALAGDATFRLCRMDLDGKRYDDALDCLASHRRRYGRSDRYADTLFLEGTIRMEVKRDCQAAMTLFDQALSVGAGDKTEEIVYRRVACLRRQGDAKARAAAQRYVERFPQGDHVDEVRGWLTD